jgi:alanine-glyoxylate transaminase/serine-glyoxylate transaminase/serine-pyruvate transaminase
MTTPLVGLLDPLFLGYLAEIQEMLRGAFRTRNPLTFAVSATGMAGMEAVLVNLLEPGDRMAVCVNGFFGGRMAEIAGRARAEVTLLERPWGEVFDPEQVRGVLQKVRPKALGVVHSETSTGALQPLADLGKLCREHDTLLVVDTVTSLGCVPVLLDEWGVDATYSCTQKGLNCPPGLSPVSFSPRAAEAISRRKTKPQSWYLDVNLVGGYWGPDRQYHHTPPATMLYALHEGLRVLHEEGLEARWERHRKNGAALAAGLTALGLSYAAAEGHRLPQLHAVRSPAGVDEAVVRKQLLTEFGIEVGSGLGEFKGKAWRIGLLGDNSRPKNVLLVLAALEQCLARQGHKVTPGAGLAAAEKVYQGAER